MKISSKKKKWAIGIVSILILLHISLPFILVRYVNNVLKDISGYTGSVEWIHVNLFRGAYQIHGLNIMESSGNMPEPFFSSQKIDLSVEWKALLNGQITGELQLVKPTLTFKTHSINRLVFRKD